MLEYTYPGRDSITFITSRTRGEIDEAHPSLFYRYVDNPLFAQRAPRVQGTHIAPRFANSINAIYPDGSINAQAIGDVSVSARTTPSGLVDVDVSPFFNTPNTFAYNVMTIGVSWDIALFELFDNSCEKCSHGEKCDKHHGNHGHGGHQGGNGGGILYAQNQAAANHGHQQAQQAGLQYQNQGMSQAYSNMANGMQNQARN